MGREVSQKQKSRLLEGAVLTKTPREVLKMMEELGAVAFSARALGLACRYRGLDMVKALIDGGARFDNFIGTNHRYDNVWLTVNGVSAREVKEGLPNHALMLLDNTQAGYDAEGVSEKDMPIIPLTARLGIADHLCENAEKCGLDSGDLLYFSILTNSVEFYKRLKKHGVVLNENIKTALTTGAAGVDWQRFQVMMLRLGTEELMSVVKTLLRELDTDKMKFTMALYFDHSYRFESSPEAFDFFLGNFDQSKMNRTAILKDIISRELIPCLAAAEKHGWLGDTKRRDEMIKYASDNGRTEATAWLLDFKNRTADLAAENKKAEKKMLRELNADPTSLSEIKKSFRFIKKADGTLIITSYSGHSTNITVPEKIGEDRVTEIGDWAFSPHQDRLRDQTRKFRKTITKITLPEGLKKIGESSFSGLISLESVNIPETVRVIGEYAFVDCNALKRIIVPEGVRDIEANAFAVHRGMSALEYVELPSTLKYFQKSCDWWSVYLFESSSCPNLVVGVPHAPHVEEFCEHNKVKFIYKEDK